MLRQTLSAFRVFSGLAKTRTVLIAGFMLVGTQSAAAQQTFGYVLDLHGDWYLNGSSKLSKGSSVTAGSSITTSSAADGRAYIVITDRSGHVFARRDCSRGECSGGIKLPDAAAGQSSVTSRLVGAVMSLISDDPGKYVSLISRGGASPEDGVVKLENDRIDLNAVFRPMNGGRYVVTFESSLATNHAITTAPGPLNFDWDPKRPTPLIVKGLGPGLYKMSLMQVNRQEMSQPAWLLLAAPRDFVAASSSFNSAVRMTQQWGVRVDQRSKRQFLRASLDFIASQSVH